MYKTVAEFYDGQSIFVTGATGFLGKVFLEKLLYSCPKLDKIYILIREQKNVTIQERLQNLKDEPVFWRLREQTPDALDKIIPIMGDVNLPKMGIKDEDEENLIKKVSIVFHVAATVNFKLKLEVAVNINTIGTERVLRLIRRMEKIKCFVYVSTAYLNKQTEVFEEEYPEPISIGEMKQLLGHGISKEKTNKLLDGRPNTYTFSKALAESLVINNHGTSSIPSIIIRPSIVTCTKEEPIVGWLDNKFGATGLIKTIYEGFSRVLLTQDENTVDIIPVDYVTNLMIVAASKCESSKEIKFYNSATSVENPLTMNYFLKLLNDYSYKYKAYIIPMPFVFVTRFKWLVSLIMLLEKVPAYLADVILCLGGNNRYSYLEKRAARVRDNVEYFTSRNWKIHASKTRALSDSLSPLDKKIFPFEPKDIVWKDYIFSYCHGIRQFLEE